MSRGKLYKSWKEEFLVNVNYKFYNESETGWWGELTLEVLVIWNPQVITLTEDRNFQWVKAEPRLKDTDALRYDRVFLIDRDLIRPSPRIVDALEIFAKFIHPELFP